VHIVNQHIGSWIEVFALVSLFSPLLSALIAVFIPSRYLWVISLTAPLCILLGLVSSLLLFFHGWQTETYLFSIPWFNLGGYPISAGIQIDDLTISMVFVVSFVSFLVHLFSTGYMVGDRDLKRYFIMLGFFTFAMVGVVLADNILLLFIFWELVGFSSYMLIGHYTEKPAAASAAKKAFIMNRIGDIAFLVGIMIIWSNTNTFQLFFLQDEDISKWQTGASLCLFGGIIGKSAQFPLLTWLPDAMTGPTPVSALIHAATMVAAGVFLLARVLFLFTPVALDVVVVTGIITSVVAALAALLQYDIKKILAYSTVSQLGFMILALGTGTKESGILHLFTHAFFKAGLFLAAG
jgi:NADH-quinone oxidoreductase subunit L